MKFTKMHGLGNDFMVIDGVRQTFSPSPDIIRRWADRHTGVGFDQLLLVETTNDADFFYRIFNADGTEVEQCGNGARCIGRFIHEKNLSDKKELRIKTKAGLLDLYIDEEITVNMGVPDIDLPTQISNAVGTFSVQTLSLGNPHCVVEVLNIDDAPVQALGRCLPDTNVEFMQIIDPRSIHLRVHERGVGETKSCGSGACAAVIAGHLIGKLASSVDVILPGGKLAITWHGKGTAVWMKGPTVTVFEGTI